VIQSDKIPLDVAVEDAENEEVNSLKRLRHGNDHDELNQENHSLKSSKLNSDPHVDDLRKTDFY